MTAQPRPVFLARAHSVGPRGLRPLPGRVAAGLAAQRHIGLYAYRVGFLARYAELAPAPQEQLESLEQLRALWHGYRIRVATDVSAPAPGVDTPEDLERVRRFFQVQDGM